MDDSDGTRPLLLEIRTNALRYWEIRRLYFNTARVTPALAGYCAFFYLEGSYRSGMGVIDTAIAAVTIETAMALLAAAIGANLLFCFAYIPDLFLQLTDMREAWRRNRWILFLLGCPIGVALAFNGGYEVAHLDWLLAESEI